MVEYTQVAQKMLGRLLETVLGGLISHTLVSEEVFFYSMAKVCF